MLDGPDAANFSALQAFGANPALQTALGFRSHLGFVQTERHFHKRVFSGGRLPFRHLDARHGRNIGCDVGQFPVGGPLRESCLRRLPTDGPMHGMGGASARSHGLDHRCGYADRITRRIYAGHAGAALLVHAYETGGIDRQSTFLRTCCEVAGLTDGDNRPVELQIEGFFLGNHHRPWDAVGIRLSGFGQGAPERSHSAI